MKTSMFVGVIGVLVLLLVVGLTGCPTKWVVSASDQNQMESRISLFEEGFNAKWPRTDDERELFRPVVVGKMCEVWNELICPQQELAEIEAQVKESGKLTPVTPEDIMKRADLTNQVRSLRSLYQSLKKSAWEAGFHDEVNAMPPRRLLKEIDAEIAQLESLLGVGG